VASEAEHRVKTDTPSSKGCLKSVRLAGRSRCRGVSGFTLIELILVMTVLTIAVSVTAPALANFFRGRVLDSEARRLLALTRQGQSRAVSEGIPMELWIDSRESKFGLEAEPSYETTDTKAVEFSLDSDLQLESSNDGQNRALTVNRFSSPTASSATGGQVLSRHAELPRIRFLADGSISESSPQKLILTGRDGITIAVAQSRNGMCYEITRGN
jgi:type II secretion system protein H